MTYDEHFVKKIIRYIDIIYYCSLVDFVEKN